MPIPKTNLFQGDRVKLSPRKINAIRSSGKKMRGRTIDRVGSIVNNTLDPRASWIYVKWDGNRSVSEKDQFLPDDLVLHEEED